MKPIILEFVGGYWDGKTLRTDSTDSEEALLAAACFETSHHGAIGGQCTGLSDDAVNYARIHGWTTPGEGGLQGGHRYLVTERRETESEMLVKLRYAPIGKVSPVGQQRPEAGRGVAGEHSD